MAQLARGSVKASAVTMELRIKPMQGYPFDLAVRVEYRLGD